MSVVRGLKCDKCGRFETENSYTLHNRDGWRKLLFSREQAKRQMDGIDLCHDCVAEAKEVLNEYGFKGLKDQGDEKE